MISWLRISPEAPELTLLCATCRSKWRQKATSYSFAAGEPNKKQLEDLKDNANTGTYTCLRIAHSLFRSNEAEGHTNNTQRINRHVT
jgi:hypothetical protein